MAARKTARKGEFIIFLFRNSSSGITIMISTISIYSLDLVYMNYKRLGACDTQVITSMYICVSVCACEFM